MFNDFKDRIQQIPGSSKPNPAPSSHCVILTGSTGAIGTYLLNALLVDKSVSHVFCLNRRTDNFSEYSNRMGIDLEPSNAERVTFLVADLAKPNLGLDSATYRALQSRATLIIHNAWPVNFNLPLSTFHPLLEGLVNLFKLSASGSYQPKLLFTSSLGSIVGYLRRIGPVHEEIITSFDAPIRSGYSESKFISELLCAEAARHLGINVVIARIGQAAGAVRTPGLWNTTEWLPRLIISSMLLKALPQSLGFHSEVNWMPIDLLAESLLEVSLLQGQGDPPRTSPETGSIEVYHFNNPNATSWTALLPAILSAFKSQCHIVAEPVPQSVWLAKVQAELDKSRASGQIDRAKLNLTPAAKLIDFYRVRMSDDSQPYNDLGMVKTLEKSEMLRNMPAIKPEWMEKWIGEWYRSLQRDAAPARRDAAAKM